jgi:hypothetical protein
MEADGGLAAGSPGGLAGPSDAPSGTQAVVGPAWDGLGQPQYKPIGRFDAIQCEVCGHGCTSVQSKRTKTHMFQRRKCTRCGALHHTFYEL